MLFRIHLLIITLGCIFPMLMQGQDIRHEYVPLDTTQGFFESGHFHFHSRTYVMGTYNEGAVSDFGAWAAGAGLGYVSPEWKGLSFGFSGFFIFKLWDENLAITDPISGGTNRYELALFDMENPENSTDLDRLEELFVRYRLGKWDLIAGRQDIETPFLNSQDNRMRPNIFSGLWTEWNDDDFRIEAGWLNSVTPRGTVDWFSMEESLGVYSFGQNVDGSASQYKGNVSTKGIFILGGEWENPRWEAQSYHYYAENIFHLSYADAIYSHPLKKETSLFFGLQSFYQQEVQEGGNPDPSMAFIQDGEQTWGLGSTLGYKTQHHHWSYNALYIDDSGRFLFPREWGREQFWASLPRDRFEGAGNVFAQSLKWEGHFFQEQFRPILGVGYVRHPEPTVALLNKYAMPSFYHLVTRLDYDFPFPFDGLTLSGLLVYKGDAGDSPATPDIAINRVDMWHYSVIADYRF